ncbi:MAG: hypothetical protein EPO65_01070 [Dehalococcoidia bacterium]|nr:MAG: hypothetical protein EPO65_01070 [Dehalococcoidia bacterium]
MTAIRRLAGLGLALVVCAGLLTATAAPAAAQQAAPYTAYGVGLRAGAMIGANIGGRSCGPAVAVTATGTWLMYIAVSSPCSPRAGDVVSFTVDGQAAEQTVTWSEGGAPANAAAGIALTVAAPKPTVTTAAAPAAGGFTGSISPSGVSLASFTGTTAQLDTAGAAVKATSISATLGGKVLTFVVGAPSFVNTEFNTAFASGLQGTLVIVKT